jgi:hypothetical protein
VTSKAVTGFPMQNRCVYSGIVTGSPPMLATVTVPVVLTISALLTSSPIPARTACGVVTSRLSGVATRCGATVITAAGIG